jgi:predicted nucleic acid-binding protein
MKELAYIDSNVFLYPVLYSKDADLRVEKAVEILKSIANGGLIAYTSVLTWDEVVWVVRKTMGSSEAQSQGQKLLGFPNLQFIKLDENILSQAQSLINKYKSKPRVAIHAASAIYQKIELIISDDQEFDEITEIKRVPLK